MRMLKILMAILVTASMTLVAEAIAQTQAPPPEGQRLPHPSAQTPAREGEKILEGQVRSVDPSGTEITLTDGTKLLVPPGATLKPGVLTEGATVVASYREQNGNKVLTGLVLTEPSASPPTEPRSPRESPAGPPSSSPKRY
jgi:hypothetical protein